AESSSSSDSDDEPAKKTPATAQKPTTNGVKRPAPADSSDSDEEPAKEAPTPAKESEVNTGSAQKKTFPKKSNEPFRRVTITKDSLPDKFKDNSFDRSFDQWGAKAHEALSKVQGKGFRHEKTKKKKGSYGGGPITVAVNSIKFSDSE
ncbi:unnamed protein product, partial [Nippostrongylus brasiliensis]|uniref:SRP40_C domain-containing protein n=1 Tax=Nippostrongylus brasiliensis TaxID=27835 RepID=A0A0N4XQ17_NIPBR